MVDIRAVDSVDLDGNFYLCGLVGLYCLGDGSRQNANLGTDGSISAPRGGSNGLHARNVLVSESKSRNDYWWRRLDSRGNSGDLNLADFDYGIDSTRTIFALESDRDLCNLGNGRFKLILSSLCDRLVQ